MQAVEQVSPRSAITTPDTSIASIPRYTCEGAGCVRIGAESNRANATLKCRVLWWDAVGAFCGASSPVTFTADASPLDGPSYLATPSTDAYWPVGGPSAFAVVVDSVSAGSSWTLNPLAF